MGPPVLAVELTDHIIDFLHDDKPALCVCALTHPTWLAASRFHLFNTITVDSGDRTKDRIAALDLSSGTQVLSYIQTVKVMSMDPGRRVSRLQDAVSLYQNILRVLSESETGSGSDGSTPLLHLYLGGDGDLGGAILPALSRISDKVTHLVLSGFTPSSNYELWPFISSFPALRSLELTNLVVSRYRASLLPAQLELQSIPLSKIRTGTIFMGFVIERLLACADEFTSLEEFGIVYEDVWQTNLVKMAEAIQRKVKVLRFSANCHPGTEYERHRRPSAFDIST